MIYIALLEGVAIIATALIFAGLVRGLIRQQARERGLLLDQMMHLAGRTWTPPPAAEPIPELEVEYDDTDQLVPWE